MKKLLGSIILLIIALFLCSVVYAQEIYSRQEFLSFGWGNGDYQLGSNLSKYYNSEDKYVGPEDAGSENIGPGPIKVNNKGEIYIQDNVNKRIIKYDTNGSFIKSYNLVFGSSDAIAFDNQDNIYLDYYGSIIEKIGPDFKGQAVLRYDRDKVPFSPKKMTIDDNQGKIYISDNEHVTEIDLKASPIEKKVNNKKIKIQPSKIYKKKIVDEIQRDEGNLRLAINSLKTEQQKTINLKSQKYKGWGVSKWVGEDKSGNTFVKTTGREKSNNIVLEKELIIATDQTGNVIGEIILDKDEKLFFDQKYLVDIDNNGNVYHLWIQKSGTKLIKWSR